MAISIKKKKKRLRRFFISSFTHSNLISDPLFLFPPVIIKLQPPLTYPLSSNMTFPLPGRFCWAPLHGILSISIQVSAQTHLLRSALTITPYPLPFIFLCIFFVFFLNTYHFLSSLMLFTLFFVAMKEGVKDTLHE